MCCHDPVAGNHKRKHIGAVGPAHGALGAGPHSVRMRVVAADGKGFYESPNYPFTVK